MVFVLQTIDLCTATADSTYFTVSFNLHPADPTAGTSRSSSAPGPTDMETEGTSDTAGPASTSSIPISPGPTAAASTGCYGIVLWFDTDFSPRFCRETPVVLSTTPHRPPTHWQQVLLTFRTPIFLRGTPQAHPSPAGLSSPADPAPSQSPAAATATVPPTATVQGAAASDGGSGVSGGLWHTAGGPVGSPQHPAESIHCRLSVGPGLKYRSLDFSIEVAAVGANGHRKGFPAQIFTL